MERIGSVIDRALDYARTILEMEKDLAGFDGEDRLHHCTGTRLCEVERINGDGRSSSGLPDLMAGSAL